MAVIESECQHIFVGRVGVLCIPVKVMARMKREVRATLRARAKVMAELGIRLVVTKYECKTSRVVVINEFSNKFQ